jgi:hypothetical protein
VCMSIFIGEVLKNSSQRIQISIDEYEGYHYISCSILKRTQRGSWKKTKKPMTLNLNCIDDVIEALRKAGEKLREMNGGINHENRRYTNME